jgi:hypothetical protein
MKILIHFLLLITLTSCSSIGDKHLDEKTFESGDIKVKWYRISNITNIHDFVDIQRWGWTKTIMEANTGGIHDILIQGDTVIIQTTPNLLIYELTARTLNCHIRLDTTITISQYMKKHVPENANYHCDKLLVDSLNKHN